MYSPHKVTKMEQDEKKLTVVPQKYSIPWDGSKKHNPSPADRFSMMLKSFKNVKPTKFK